MLRPVPFPLFHDDFLRILLGVVELMCTSQDKWSEPDICSKNIYAHLCHEMPSPELDLKSLTATVGGFCP